MKTLIDKLYRIAHDWGLSVTVRKVQMIEKLEEWLENHNENKTREKL